MNASVYERQRQGKDFRQSVRLAAVSLLTRVVRGPVTATNDDIHLMTKNAGQVDMIDGRVNLAKSGISNGPRIRFVQLYNL